MRLGHSRRHPRGRATIEPCAVTEGAAAQLAPAGVDALEQAPARTGADARRPTTRAAERAYVLPKDGQVVLLPEQFAEVIGSAGDSSQPGRLLACLRRPPA